MFKMLGLIYLTENDDRFNTTQLPSHIINIPITNRILAMQVHPNVADNLRFLSCGQQLSSCRQQIFTQIIIPNCILRLWMHPILVRTSHLLLSNWSTTTKNSSLTALQLRFLESQPVVIDVFLFIFHAFHQKVICGTFQHALNDKKPSSSFDSFLVCIWITANTTAYVTSISPPLTWLVAFFVSQDQ